MFLVFAADGSFIFRNGEVDGNAYGHWTQDGNAVSIKGEGGTTQDYKDAFTMIGTYTDSARLSVSSAGSVRNYIKLCQADCVNATIDSLNHGGGFRP